MVADLDGDGNLDVLLLQSGGNANLHLGKGDGTFTFNKTFTVMPTNPPYAFWAGIPDAQTARLVDVNKDGKPDLIVSHAFPNRIQVMLNDSQ